MKPNPDPSTRLLRAAPDVVASEWLMRRDAGLDAAEEKALQDWLDADPGNEDAFRRLGSAAAVFDRVRESALAPVVLARLAERARRRRRRRLGLAAGVAAAALLLPALWTRDYLAASSQVFHASPTVFEPIRRLPDGSVVELKPGSEVAVNYSPSARRIRLVRGEAHFQVEPDPARPFVVSAGALGVRAVGTGFAVQLQRDAVEVVVTEGRVAVDRFRDRAELPGAGSARGPDGHAVPAGGPDTVALVDAGQRVRVDTTTDALALERSAVSEAQMEARLQWRVQRVKFSGMDLAQAVALMNRANSVEIILADDSIRRLRVSGIFHAHNPEGFARVLAGTFDLRAEQTSAKQIVLRRAAPVSSP